jgi:DNA-binding HxlR family transcriptional regulator
VQVKRSYDDPCGVARALDAVGERWALLVVRELLHGPKRFTALSGALPGISQNVLSQRLRELEQAGVVRRRAFGPPASTRGYELTQRGYELEPVLLALARWGSRIPLGPGGSDGPSAELSTDALVLALRTTFDPEIADGTQARIELRLGDDCFHAEIEQGQFRITRGAAGQPDATLRTNASTLRAVVFGGRPVADAEHYGDLQIDGNRQAATNFTRCFPRPATEQATGPA